MYSGLSLDSGRCSGSQSHLRGAVAGQGKYSYRQIRRRQRWQRLVKAQSAELRSIGPSSSRFDGRTSLGQSSAWARLYLPCLKPAPARNPLFADDHPAMLVIDLAAFNCDVEGERLTHALSAIGLVLRCFFCQTSLSNPGEYLESTELHTKISIISQVAIK